ncbi:HlyD family secretion protein [Cysteiniphilum sp. 6C5]|uniref:HlyD family secretion protein n=1 Tax=unclassified Cysteiniphilum TaxID=2610889 RepID=UPI003F83ECF4
MMKPIKSMYKMIAVVSLVLIVVIVTLYWRMSQQDSKALPGYIEANLSYISSSVSGRLVSLDVHKGQLIKKGQLLFTLEKAPYQLQTEVDKASVLANQYTYEDLLTGKRRPYIDQVEAEIKKAQADLEYARLSYERSQTLIKDGSISQQAYDLDLSKYNQAVAQLETLKAELVTYKLKAREKQIQSAKAKVVSSQKNQALSQWYADQTNIVAKSNAMVFDTYYWPNEEVQSYKPIVSLLIPEQIKLIFYVPEPDLHQIAIGQMVYFRVDGLGQNNSATISYVSPEAEYTPPVIYSQSTRADLSFKVEAKIDKKAMKNWHPGQPVSVYLTKES